MEMEQYRDFSEFCEQLNDIKQKFHKWDSCEKTVALYYLMVGLPFANARFLQHALEQGIVAVNSTETQILEQNANDSNVILNFLLEQPDVVLSLLLSHLPLLKPGNKGAAKCYLRVIRQILLEFVTPPYKIYNECVEVISYVYIHPAFSNEDKKSFKNLLKQVLIKVSPDNFIHSFGTESSDESLSPSSDVTENSHKNSRSNSLTPSQDIASPKPPSKPRSYSLCTDKLLNTVITTTQQNRSEIRLQDLVLRNNTPAMKSIIAWLKSLRLHKYSWVFNNLTYTHMINLTDETLQAIGITKGARHKLLISIIKLKERSTLLSELERGIMKGGDINNALKKLKNILQTPLEISMDNENLPSQFVKVMGKATIFLIPQLIYNKKATINAIVGSSHFGKCSAKLIDAIKLADWTKAKHDTVNVQQCLMEEHPQKMKFVKEKHEAEMKQMKKIHEERITINAEEHQIKMKILNLQEQKFLEELSK